MRHCSVSPHNTNKKVLSPTMECNSRTDYKLILRVAAMTRGLLVILLAALTGTASPQNTNGAPPSSFDPKHWLEDFHQILSEMSVHYANLE